MVGRKDLGTNGGGSEERFDEIYRNLQVSFFPFEKFRLSDILPSLVESLQLLRSFHR